MQEQILAQTHPQWLKLIVSKNPLVVSCWLIPVYALYFHTVQNTSPQWGMLLLGLLYWSFIEYAIHRWVYHVNYTRRKVRWFIETLHLHHHRDMSDHRVLNAGPVLIYPMVVLLLAPVYLLSGSLVSTAWLGLGLTSAYYFYEWVHYGIHYTVYERGYMAYIQKYHMHHHDRAWNANFGNTSHFWDLVFGTYDSRHRQFSLDQRLKSMTIKHS